LVTAFEGGSNHWLGKVELLPPQIEGTKNTLRVANEFSDDDMYPETADAWHQNALFNDIIHG
jgi:hypothetical protein